MHAPAPLAILLALPLSACSDDEPSAPECEVAIIGGGVGGLHTAFRLAPELGDRVCLFEKEPELGGRIKDVSLDDDPDAPRVGAGARRIMETQEVLFSLADELDLTLETPPVTADLINARDAFAFSKEELVPLYGITPSADGDTETALYDALRFGPERANAGAYEDFEAYVRAVVGDEGYAYLHDMSRFRGDFTYRLDARSYLDWLDEEWDVCCTASYPVGGMSRFIVGMADRAEADGARIFTSEAVLDVSRADGGYQVETEGRTVLAAKVVLAVPPTGLAYIEGDVVEEIRAQATYQAITPVHVTTITQWWDTAWYADVVDPNAAQDANVWRAWTTEHCLNFIEIPQEPYAAAANVTRSVYDDDIDCEQYWTDLAAQGDGAVEAAIHEGLTHLFDGNGVSEPASLTVPDPLSTTIQVWPDAWHWLGAGSPVSNAELFDWALDPLGEDVALVGEAYNVQRSAWSDAAYKSSIHLLNERYGMSLPGL